MLGNYQSPIDWKIGDRVEHYRDVSLTGTVIHVEENRLSVLVLWDDDNKPDFQWSNKLISNKENNK